MSARASDSMEGEAGPSPAVRRRDGGAAGVESSGPAAAIPASRGGLGLSPESKKKLSLWGMYLQVLKEKPLLTKSLTTGVLMAIGNVAAQGIVIAKGKQKGISMRKVLSFVVFGIFISGPLGHAWLKFLNGRKNKLKGQKLILYKIALDRLAFGPCFNLLQMVFVYKASGQSWPQVLTSLKNTFWSAQVLNWKMWPFAQFVNFNFVPPDLQLLYMNLIALVWTIALSSIMN